MAITRKEYNQRVAYREQWETIISQPSIGELPNDAQRIIDEFAYVGYKHAQSKPDYQDDLFDCLAKWAMHTLPESTHFTPEFVYDDDIGSIDFIRWDGVEVKLPAQGTTPQMMTVPSVALLSSQAKQSEREYMSRMIPLSYAVMGAVFLSLTYIFAFAFYSGCHGGSFIIGPWSNLMLLIAALGLTVTVIVATVEWRKLQGVHR